MKTVYILIALFITLATAFYFWNQIQNNKAVLTESEQNATANAKTNRNVAFSINQ